MELDQLAQGFLDEANELIMGLEEALLNLESNPEDEESIASVFRVMHTLKGSGAMFGFQSVSSFTHLLENIYDSIRSHKLQLNTDILNLTFESVDLIKSLLKNKEITEDIRPEYDRLILEFENICEGKASIPNPPAENKNQIEEIENQPTYYIYFAPNQEILQNGTNPLYLIDELISLGKGNVFAHINNIPEFNALDSKLCLVSWDIILSTKADISEILDVFIFVEDDSKIEIQKISEINLLDHRSFTERLPAYISENQETGVLELQELAEQLEQDILSNHSVSVSPNKDSQTETRKEEPEIAEIQEKTELPETSLKETVKLTQATEVSNRSKSSSSIRVSSYKVETLINLVSEMVTTQARLSLLAQNANNSEILEVAETLEKLTRQLRDNAFEISLIPISSLVTRFQRLIRDLSKELNKDVIFETEGTDTELDKTIIENLSDPLMHLFRNAIDHGLENKEERIAAGKPEKGKLLFKAYYSGTNVYIDIIDDGKGINTEKVKEKAIEKGLIKENKSYSNKQIHELIMLPGFSTSENITDISGRGVGMDVVKKNINKIQGDIDIYSEPGKGTTFSLKLPLTLSIIDGLLVQIDQKKYIIPILLIKKIAPISKNRIKLAFNNTISIDGVQLPFLDLREEFNITTETPDIQEAVVVHYGDKEVAIVIDRVIRESQVVVKSLGKHFKDQEIISGASIMGDGLVALVLDTNKIIEKYSR